MMSEKQTQWKEDGKPISRKMATLIFGPLVLIVVGAGFYLLGDRYVSTDNAYIKAKKTSISAEVSGKIIEVKVQDNTRVAKGEELFMIDPEPFQIAVDRAQANLENVRTQIESLRSDYLQKKAQLGQAEESLRYYQQEYDRFQKLAKKKVVPQEKSDAMEHDYNNAVQARDADEQAVEAVKAKLGGAVDVPVDQQPQYLQAKAELEKAKYDLSRVKVVAPSDGVVANVNIEPGEYTAAGLPLFTLVNDHDVWVEANFKETDLTYVRAGQAATIEVDTYPGVKWDATVSSVTPATGAEFSILPAQNSSGNWVKVVQRIMVRMDLKQTRGKPPLVAGMSTVTTIDTGANRLERLLGEAPETKE